MVGQQKLKGLEFQTNPYTKLISKRICGENTRAPLSTEFEEHSKLCDKSTVTLAEAFYSLLNFLFISGNG